MFALLKSFILYSLSVIGIEFNYIHNLALILSSPP